MQSRKLVAKGRENLGMSTSEPWTTALEAECIKLYEAEHGPVKERDYSTPAAEVATTPPRSFVKPSTTTSTPAKSTVPKLPAKSPKSVFNAPSQPKAPKPAEVKPTPPTPESKKEEPPAEVSPEKN